MLVLGSGTTSFKRACGGLGASDYSRLRAHVPVVYQWTVWGLGCTGQTTAVHCTFCEYHSLLLHEHVECDMCTDYAGGWWTRVEDCEGLRDIVGSTTTSYTVETSLRNKSIKQFHSIVTLNMHIPRHKPLIRPCYAPRRLQNSH
jgi:hypothetical protein